MPEVHLAGGGRGSSAVERATPGEEVPGSIPAVWCLIFDPSRIILTKAKSGGRTASVWQSAWNDPVNISQTFLCVLPLQLALDA